MDGALILVIFFMARLTALLASGLVKHILSFFVRVGATLHRCFLNKADVVGLKRLWLAADSEEYAGKC